MRICDRKMCDSRTKLEQQQQENVCHIQMSSCPTLDNYSTTIVRIVGSVCVCTSSSTTTVESAVYTYSFLK